MGLAAWLVDRQRRAYSDLATTPAAAVFAGRNEVKGRAWAADPLVNHRSETPAIWWSSTLEEQRRHTRTVTSTDSQGNSHSRVETYHQWHEIDRKGAQLPWCEVVHDTGSIPVRLEGAQVATVLLALAALAPPPGAATRRRPPAPGRRRSTPRPTSAGSAT